MRAAVWYGRKDVRVVDVPDSPSPGPGEVKIKVAWVGVCGTDLHEYAAGPIFMPIEPHPQQQRRVSPGDSDDGRRPGRPRPDDQQPDISGGCRQKGLRRMCPE